MKIIDIKSYLVEAERRNWVFIEVETNEGVTGVGEAKSNLTLVGRPLSRPIPTIGPIG